MWLCRRASGSQRFERLTSLRLPKASRFFKISGTTRPTTWSHVSEDLNLERIRVFVCVWQVLGDKHSNYLWCPSALRNADRNLRLSCSVSEITPRDKTHSTLLYLRHPSATLIQERLMLRGSSTTPSGNKLFSQGKIWGFGEVTL